MGFSSDTRSKVEDSSDLTKIGLHNVVKIMRISKEKNLLVFVRYLVISRLRDGIEQEIVLSKNRYRPSDFVKRPNVEGVSLSKRKSVYERNDGMSHPFNFPTSSQLTRCSDGRILQSV